MGIREFFAAEGRKLIEEQYAWSKVLPQWDKVIEELKVESNQPYPVVPMPKQVNLEDLLTGEKKNRILYVMPGTFGDVFMSTAVIDGLKKKYPNKDIYFVTDRRYQDILQGNKQIHKVLDHDVIFNSIIIINNLFDSVYTPYLETQSRDNWNWTRNGTGKHIAQVYADHCNVELGTPFIDTKEVAGLPAEYVVVHTKTGQEPKNYLEYQRIANRVGLPVIQVGSPDDPLIRGSVDMRGKAIQETAYIIKNAKVFIGGDSICGHLAGFFKTPAILIYGSTYPNLTRPLGVESGKLITIEPTNRFGCDRPCHLGKCMRGRRSCIDTIDVKEVIKALEVFRIPTKEAPPPKISGYTTTLNPDASYPWRECIKSMLGFCDEVVVADGASTDGTYEELKEWKKREPKLKVYKRKWREDEPAMDGMMKAYARALCTGEFCWQMDCDEIVHEKDYDMIRKLAAEMPYHIKVVTLPVLDLFGSTKTVRTDRGLYKWRLSRNLPEITQGIPKQLRKTNAAGKTYCDFNQCDGCFYINSETGESIDGQTSFVTPDLMEAMQKDTKKYIELMKPMYKAMPSVWHYSWYDLKRRMEVDLKFWDKQWASLGQTDVVPENRFFPGVAREKITPELMKERAEFLKDKKLDGTPMELLTIDWAETPAVMKEYLAKRGW